MGRAPASRLCVAEDDGDCRRVVFASRLTGSKGAAFSSGMDTGSHEENASIKNSGPFSFSMTR
jgi:hypothetical protein